MAGGGAMRIVRLAATAALNRRAGAVACAVAIALLALTAIAPVAHAVLPVLVASEPASGAIGVDPALDAIVVQFSEPMNPSYQSFTLPAAWGTSTVSWTSGYHALTIRREDTNTWLPARDLLTLVLSPAGSVNGFRDFDGNLLPETRITFGIEPYEDFPAVIATDPPNGAVGVAPSRTTVSVTFDEPMADTVSLGVSPRWGASTTNWSADQRTLYVTRTAATPLESDSRIQIDLDITPGAIDWLHPPAFLRNPRGDRLPAYSLSFQVASQVDPPRVLGTDPANGEVRDDPNLAEIVISFDRPMALGTCTGFSTTGDEWGDPDAPPAADYWSPDFRSYHIVRNNPATLLRTGKEITVRLNPQECTRFLFQGADGHVLGAYTFTFTIGDGDTVLHAVPADPAQGFPWPYYLGIPPALSPHASLLVEPNNTGAVSDDLAVHDRAAEALGAGLANYAAELGVPWLVPVFPRPQTPPIYTHSLDRDTLLATAPGLERIDLQLVAMMADARRRLAERDLAVGPRALLAGFSASGAFVHRFAALHPELVQAVATGSGAGWPLAPVAEWDGIPLRYPVGIADLAALVGTPFAAASYRRVPLFVYVGDADENDPVPGWDPVDRDAVFALTGVSSGPIWPRWPVSQEIHEGAAMSAAEFVIYPGVGHAFNSDMQRDVQDFFVAAMPELDAGLGGAAALCVLTGLAVRARSGRNSA
jgi:dienelactone hydrolase